MYNLSVIGLKNPKTSSSMCPIQLHNKIHASLHKRHKVSHGVGTPFSTFLLGFWLYLISGRQLVTFTFTVGDIGALDQPTSFVKTVL